MQNDKTYIGIINWFFDKRRNAPYGFINNDELGSIFFHKKSIISGTKRIAEGDVVFFNIKPSLKRKGEFEAQNIRFLTEHTDPNLICSFYLQYLTEEEHNNFLLSIFNSIQDFLLSLPIDHFKDFFLIFIEKLQFILKNISNNKIISNTQYYIPILSRAKRLYKDNFDSIIKDLISFLDNDTLFILWKKSIVDSLPQALLSKYFKASGWITQKQILEKLPEDEKLKLIIEYLSVFLPLESKQKQEKIIDFLKNIKIHVKVKYNKIFGFLVSNTNINFKYRLWISELNHYFEHKNTPLISAITFPSLNSSELIQYLEPEYLTLIVQHFWEYPNDTQERIFKILNQDQLIYIIESILSNFNIIDDENKFSKSLDLLKYVEKFSSNNLEQITNKISTICNDFYLIKFWYLEYLKNINYFIILEKLSLFNNKEQEFILKKLFRAIHNNKFIIKTDDLLNIFNEITNQKSLNISIAIILHTLIDLHKKRQILTREKIFDIILNHVVSHDQLLKIGSFFEKCNGRKIVLDNDISVIKKPNFIEFCEGRKANKDGKPILDKKNGKEFWWCANQKCFGANQFLHDEEDWKDYTLRDFLEILHIPYNFDQYYIFIGILNKINNFLEHLICRECGAILYPVKQSNYAFYRVNLFKCANPNCTINQKGIEIYISHCINGKCNNVIDSRDTVRCKPEGFEDTNCGWYICDYCLACCSTEGINKRKYIFDKTGQEYTCHIEGHRDKNQICCPKCGTIMEDTELKYKKLLKWFLDRVKRKEIIVKYGRRKDGKYWFLYKRSPSKSYDEFRKILEKIEDAGFSIPDIYEDKDVYLIGESFKKIETIFKCPSCDFELNINELEKNHDYDRLNALRYHIRLENRFQEKMKQMEQHNGKKHSW